MNDKQECQVTLYAKKPGGEMSSMQLTISTNGPNVSITGIDDDGEKYEGTLILKKKGRKEGDHCWVCDDAGRQCVWTKPCPY